MFLGILTLITALSISAVAIYYSVAGLMTIFAAAAIPIMIMGGVLEVSKLVTAVWLHRYWRKAAWWLKTYLVTAVVVLMFITSMGIFGFLSKAHIEQTASANEGVAQLERIESEITRNEQIIARAEQKITDLGTSGTGADANIQSQIDKEQERIDRAFERIQPAIQQQNQIIADARTNDASRTKPYEDQLANIQAEVLRLETSAREYEDKIATLSADTSAVDPLLEQIDAIEQEIIRVTNQVNSGERDQIRAGQAIIGVTSDGAFGSNTRKALVAWVAAQRERITQIQGEVSQLRVDATNTVDAERTRLAGVVKDIRETQIPALKERELQMLSKIDEVRQTESPAIATARDEIQRLRESAESQVAQSQALIERLRSQLAQADKAQEIERAITEQNDTIRTASNEVDRLFEEKFKIEAEYRKLEAEVGPVKYIAEFIYGERADSNLLEEAVRWVIITIIFVFDPLAVLLLIAAQYTFEFHRKPKDDDGERLRQEYEQARAQRIVDNPGFNINTPAPPQEEKEQVDEGLDIQVSSTNSTGIGDNGRDITDGVALARQGDIDDVARTYITTDDTSRDSLPEDDTALANAVDIELEQDQIQSNESQEKVKGNIPNTKNRMFYQEEIETPEQIERRKIYNELEEEPSVKNLKQQWKADHPNENLKIYKDLYIQGKIENLPWLEGYQQNSEQNENSLWNKIRQDR